jgi:hypothetical protein
MLSLFGDSTKANWPDSPLPGSVDDVNVFVKWTLLCGLATANWSDTKNEMASAGMIMIANMTSLFNGSFVFAKMFKRF